MPSSIHRNIKQDMLCKVPEITLLFWITKILTTGMGEVFSDYLAHTLAPVKAVCLGALGTAAGDLTATTLHLGYFTSGVLFAVIFAVPAIGVRFFGMNRIFAFWFAYIFTRPLGASFADWMGVPRARGGLEWGTGPVSLVLTILIVMLVGYLSLSKRDVAGKQTIE